MLAAQFTNLFICLQKACHEPLAVLKEVSDVPFFPRNLCCSVLLISPINSTGFGTVNMVSGLFVLLEIF